MKLAESARVRWVLAAATFAFAGSAAALIATRAPAPRPTRVDHHRPMVIGGCHEHKAAPVAIVPPIPHEITGADYRDALMVVRPALTKCLLKADKSVRYKVNVDLAGNGSVKFVDVRSEATDMRKVSLKTVECINAAVSAAKFPAAGHEKRVSTTLRP